MKNKFFTLLIVPLVILSLFSGLVKPAHAQGVETPTPEAVLISSNPSDVTFYQIRQSEIQLNGPFDSNSLVFGLPANWRLSGLAKLQLNLAVSFNTAAQQSANGAPVLQGGTLTVRFNGVNLGAFPLNKVGEVSESIDIPESAFASLRSDGRMELSFILDSGLSCYFSQQMTVFVHTNSILTLPHELVAPEISFQNFPQPLYQGSVFPESALIVVPDQPSSAELQAALTVAAGLSNLTNNGLTLDMTSAGKLTADRQAANQLILVGKAVSLPLLSGLSLPLPVSGGKFNLDSAAPDNGVVQLINASGTEPRAILVVSGNTDAGVVKAAQAVSTGFLRPGASPNLSIVEQVQPNPVNVSVPVDQSLGTLNLASGSAPVAGVQAVKTLRFSTSIGSTSYRFYMPPGQTVSPASYFDLVFGHSSLLNYARSGLVVSINGQPIGSVRLSDATAAQANNHVQFNIPASVIIPGYNRLEIKATLIPTDICVSNQLDGLWVSIWPDSNLHMPLIENLVAPFSTTDLSTYPAPFVYQPTLATTAFVLPHENLEAWRSALRISSFLGNRTNGALYVPAVFYGDELKDPDRAKYNLLVIGQPSQLPVVADLNASLPGPFENGSDIAAESNMQVKYNVPPSLPVGYIELSTSPWNQNNLVISVLGNSPQGVTWAASALVDAPLRSRLAGNFVIISGQQMITSDTRANSVSGSAIQVVAPTVSGGKLDLTPLPASQPAWVLPAIYIAIGLIALVLVIAAIGALARARNARSY